MLGGGGGSVAFEVFVCISVYSERDYTCQYILYYLSELVVLEPSRAGLYLEGCALILDCGRD